MSTKFYSEKTIVPLLFSKLPHHVLRTNTAHTQHATDCQTKHTCGDLIIMKREAKGSQQPTNARSCTHTTPSVMQAHSHVISPHVTHVHVWSKLILVTEHKGSKMTLENGLGAGTHTDQTEGTGAVILRAVT